LALGAAGSAVGVPNVLRLIESGFPWPDGNAWRSVLIVDVAYLAVGVIGLALVLLSRLLDQAGRAQADAERLSAELGEFF
jgi:hypothetical protein